MFTATAGTTMVSLLLLTSVHSQSTIENGTANSSNSTGWTTGDVTVDESLQAAADLKEMILSRPVVQQKVTRVAPLPSENGKINVDVAVLLVSVLKVDDMRQTMTSTLLFTVRWRDRSLSWSPSSHKGVQMLEMKLDSIWIPIIFVINSVDLFNHILSHVYTVLVYSDGTVLAAVPIVMETTCIMDHTRFPYDTQVCSVQVSSLSDDFTIHLSTDFVDQSQSTALIQKADWELLSIIHTLLYYSSDSPLVPSAEVTLKRRTMFYTMCLVVPMVLTSYMNILVFLIPLLSGEKISFLVTIIVSISVFISFFSDVMPRSLDSIPTTMKLLLGVIVESLVVLLATVFVMKRFQCEQIRAETTAAAALTSRSSSDDPNKAEDAVIGGVVHKKRRDSCLDSSRCVQVAPATEGEFEKEYLDKADVKRSRFDVTASSLDRLFFVLAFVGNTVFMLVLFYD